jgi:hypothetical protein
MTEEMEFDFGHWQKLSFSPQSPDQLLDLSGRTHQIPGVCSRGKVAEELTHRLSQSSVDVKNICSYSSTNPYGFMPQCLIKHRNKLHFTFVVLYTDVECVTCSLQYVDQTKRQPGWFVLKIWSVYYWELLLSSNRLLQTRPSRPSYEDGITTPTKTQLLYCMLQRDIDLKGVYYSVKWAKASQSINCQTLNFQDVRDVFTRLDTGITGYSSQKGRW